MVDGCTASSFEYMPERPENALETDLQANPAKSDPGDDRNRGRVRREGSVTFADQKYWQADRALHTSVLARIPKQVMKRKGPLILALETAIGKGSIALLNEKTIVAESDASVSRAEELLASIESLLAQANVDLREVDRIAVSVGPGSYTGIRIGIATIRGLMRACSLEGIGVSVLESLAWSSRADNIASLVPIGRRRFAYQLFSRQRSKLITRDDPIVIAESALSDLLRDNPELEFVIDSRSFEKVASDVLANTSPNVLIQHSSLAVLMGQFVSETVFEGPLEPIYL